MEGIKETGRAALGQNETLIHFICGYIHALPSAQPADDRLTPRCQKPLCDTELLLAKIGSDKI
jgi:hypothetical protein